MILHTTTENFPAHQSCLLEQEGTEGNDTTRLPHSTVTEAGTVVTWCVLLPMQVRDPTSEEQLGKSVFQQHLLLSHPAACVKADATKYIAANISAIQMPDGPICPNQV